MQVRSHLESTLLSIGLGEASWTVLPRQGRMNPHCISTSIVRSTRDSLSEAAVHPLELTVSESRKGDILLRFWTMHCCRGWRLQRATTPSEDPHQVSSLEEKFIRGE